MGQPWNKGLDHGFSSFDINQPGPIGMALFIPIALFGLQALYDALGWWKGRKTKAGTPISRMVAMEFAFGIPCIWFGYHGACLYFGWNGVDELYKSPLIDNPYYGESDYVLHNLLWSMFMYQAWNVLVALFLIPELGKWDNVLHHTITCAVQYFGFYGFLHYHCFFFIGVVELSSIPLTFVDMSRYIEEFPAQWPNLYQVSNVTFAASFVVLRLCLWPFVAYRVVYDLITMVINSEAHSNFVVLTFVSAVVILTGLQWFWGVKIVKKSLVTLGLMKKPEPRTDKKQQQQQPVSKPASTEAVTGTGTPVREAAAGNTAMSPAESTDVSELMGNFSFPASPDAKKTN